MPEARLQRTREAYWPSFAECVRIEAEVLMRSMPVVLHLNRPYDQNFLLSEQPEADRADVQS